jgi:hypothetical protein
MAYASAERVSGTTIKDTATNQPQAPENGVLPVRA